MCEPLSGKHLAAFKAALAEAFNTTESVVDRLVELWKPVVIHYQAFQPSDNAEAPIGYLVVGTEYEPTCLVLNDVVGNFSEDHGLWAIRMMVHSDDTGKLE